MQQLIISLVETYVKPSKLLLPRHNILQLYPSAFRIISPHTPGLDISLFSWIVPTNSIMDLITHSSLLYPYMSQMYPHADAQYDHMYISVLFLQQNIFLVFHSYRAAIIHNIPTEWNRTSVLQSGNISCYQESLYSWPLQIHHILYGEYPTAYTSLWRYVLLFITHLAQ